MKRKTKTAYVCNDCGQDHPKWQGRCDSCGAWNTLAEFRIAGKTGPEKAGVARVTSEIRTLQECAGTPIEYTPSEFEEIDRVLGGGVVESGVTLIGGDPGIGKSTLLLQLAAQWAKSGKSVLYVSGEESSEQVSLRARRLGVDSSPALVLAETVVETIVGHLETVKPDIVVVDSIQTMVVESIENTAGSVAQVRESAATLLRYAKTHGSALFLVGHVTKEGALAGPRILEHMVDTVLYFEGDSHNQYRMVRAIKNRFGPSGEVAILSMTDRGLVGVTNPSDFFLSQGEETHVGTSIVPIVEGTRVLVVELQGLVNRSHFGMPQRVASGISPKKLSLVLAVLERYGGIVLGDHDIFFNIAGGLTVSEPAVDLGIAAAILSSFRNSPAPSRRAFLGELGLSGEVRPVNRMAARLKELSRLGFNECVVAPPPPRADWKKTTGGMRLMPCSRADTLAEFMT